MNDLGVTFLKFLNTDISRLVWAFNTIVLNVKK